MPRSTVQASPELLIQLDDNRSAWTGGDVITGRVSRCAPVVSPQATMSITLLGRAKTKMTVSRGQAGTSIYRGRFNFFAPEQTRVQLWSGPIHIPEMSDLHSWPFSVQVPAQLDPAAVVDKNQQKFSYLPLGFNEVSAQAMPPSFFAKGFWFNTTYEAYNEYFLLAELTTESKGSVKTQTATLPVDILDRTTRGPISDFHPQRFGQLCHLKSHLLIPGAEKSSLSLQQRTQHFFRSSKVPQYSFTLQVDCPRLLQIGNPTPIPFTLLAIPEPSHTTDVLQDQKLELTVTSIQLEIWAWTDVLCRGTIASHNASGSRKIRLIDGSAISECKSALVVPSSSKAEPLDVGKALGLTLAQWQPDLRTESSTQLAQSLFPTFTTYNIQHHHTLEFKIELGSSGATTKVSGKVELTLLATVPASDAPPYAPRVPPKDDITKDGTEEDIRQNEPVPTYAEAVPSSSGGERCVSEKSKENR